MRPQGKQTPWSQALTTVPPTRWLFGLPFDPSSRTSHIISIPQGLDFFSTKQNINNS